MHSDSNHHVGCLQPQRAWGHVGPRGTPAATEGLGAALASDTTACCYSWAAVCDGTGLMALPPMRESWTEFLALALAWPALDVAGSFVQSPTALTLSCWFCSCLVLGIFEILGKRKAGAGWSALYPRLMAVTGGSHQGGSQSTEHLWAERCCCCSTPAPDRR